MNKLQGIEDSPVMEYLDQFSDMVARSLVMRVQNEPDNDRTPKDYADLDLMEKVNNQE